MEKPQSTQNTRVFSPGLQPVAWEAVRTLGHSVRWAYTVEPHGIVQHYPWNISCCQELGQKTCRIGSAESWGLHGRKGWEELLDPHLLSHSLLLLPGSWDLVITVVSGVVGVYTL